MKKFVLFIITLLCSLISFGQSLEWIDSINYSGVVTVVGLWTDQQELVAAGSFGSELNNQSYGCMFSHRYNLHGTKLFTDTFHRQRFLINDIEVDAAGNYYILADHPQDSGSTIFGNYQLNGRPEYRSILIKFDNNNQVLWAKRLTNSGMHKMAFNKTDNAIYFSGNGALDTLYFDNFSLPSGGYVAKYDLNGNCIWAKKVSEHYAYFITSDSFGNVYVNNKNSVTSGYLLTKLNKHGTEIWDYSLGNQGGMLASDSVGNCYVTGARYANSGVVQDNYFLDKISPNGMLEWSIKSNFGGVGQALFINDSGYIYAGGNYGSGNHHSDGMGIAKYDANGNEVWHYQLADLDPNINNKVSKITEKDGAVYVGGQLSQQYPKGFILKLHEPGVTTAIPEQNHLAGFSIYPNPGGSEFTLHYKNEKSKDPLFIYVRSITGQLVYTQTIPYFNGELREVINIGSQAKGNYFIELKQGEAIEVRKLVVQ